MKVLIVNTVTFRLNGITSVIMNYYRNMDRTGMQIDFVVKNELSEELRAELESGGATVHYIPRNSDPLRYMRRLYRVCKEGGYDVVHIHGNSAMMLPDVLPALFARVPVRIVHSHSTNCSHVTLHKLFKPLFHRCYTHGFACGEDAGRWLYGTHPFTILKNGVDLKRFRFNPAVREEYRRRLGVDEQIVIGHIGYFYALKNHSFLLDAFAKTAARDERYRLLLIGDGDLLRDMKDKAAALGVEDKVRFLGNTTEVAQYIQAMDVLTLPSLHEGLPVVLVEAQAAGLPCVVSDRVAKEADLTDSLRYLPIDDAAVWAEAFTQIDADEGRRAIRCDEWQRRIAEAGYDVAANADRMKEYYKAFYAQRKKG